MNTLTVEDLLFELRWSGRRRTVELTVERDGSLVLKAPEGTGETVLEDFVREKRMWLYGKLAEKDAFAAEVPQREYVSGEGFHYLGRSYRLLIVDEQTAPLKLVAGRFRLRRDDIQRGREEFIRWYTDHARTWLRRRMGPWAERMGVEPTAFEVRDLGYRWGSCGQAGSVNFHWQTILLPASVVDYVVVHELAHLIELNHTPQFWACVSRALPEYERRKEWLAENGARYVVL